MAGETTRQALEAYPVGGLIYSVDNLVTQEQTREMIENTQSYSKLPLIISADEEGGNVGRLMYKLGTTFFHSMFSYKDEGAEVAYQNAYTIGTDMTSWWERFKVSSQTEDNQRKPVKYCLLLV